MTKLFLDDERFPPDGSDMVIVRSVAQAIAWVEANGFPSFVSFDNDLGPGEKEGWEFAQWLIDRDLDTGAMPANFDYYVHSMNPVRANDMRKRLERYMRFKQDNG